MRREGARGQSITDYAIAISMVVVTLVTMQTFIRRYVQAEIRGKTDDLLAISDADATNPDWRGRGMETQRLGHETFRQDAGIGGTSTIFNATTTSNRQLTEQITGGKLRVTRDESHIRRRGDQQVSSSLPNPAPLSVPPGAWFRRQQDAQASPRPRETGRRPNP